MDKAKLVKLLILGIVAINLMACNRKKSDEASVGSARGARGGANIVGTQGTLPNGGFNSGSIGYVTDYSNNWDNAVKAFLSATLAPNYIGSVNNRNGFAIRLTAQCDNQGNLAQGSYLEISITDQYTGQSDGQGGTIPPITMKLNATGGNCGNGGQATLNFGDQYGSVSLVGSRVGSQFGGKFHFQNSTIYEGASSAPYGGTLGDFVINL